MTMDYDLGIDELRDRLKQQQALLEEVEEERLLILGQQNLHLSSKLVTKYQNELGEIKETILKIEKILADYESK
jgi:hypothetical protein